MTKNPPPSSTPTTAPPLPSSSPPPQSPKPLDLLILGLGWSTQFILPLLTSHHLTHATTTRHPSRDPSSIPFTFDPSSTSTAPYARLPSARTVLITFPLLGKGQSARLTGLYGRTHGDVAGGGGGGGGGASTTTTEGGKGVRYIQLASSSVFASPGWNDESSPYTPDDPYTPSPPNFPPGKGNRRAVAEDELLSLHGENAVVLALAGLYDGRKGGRDPREWVRSGRVVRGRGKGGGKEGVRGLKGVHFVHGGDVGRGVLGVLMGVDREEEGKKAGDGEGEGESGKEKKNKVWGKRWIVTDLRVYDWWDLIMSWADADADANANADEVGKRQEGDKEGKEGKEGNEVKHYRKWVMECMRESGVRALPREKEELGRKLDGRGFWEAIGWWPGEGRVG